MQSTRKSIQVQDGNPAQWCLQMSPPAISTLPDIEEELLDASPKSWGNLNEEFWSSWFKDTHT